MGEMRVSTPPSVAIAKPEIPVMHYGKGEYHGPSRNELGHMEFPDPAESDITPQGLEHFEAASRPETPSQANVRVKLFPQEDAPLDEGEAEDYASAFGINKVRIGSATKPPVK